MMNTNIDWNPGMTLAAVEKQVIQKCLQFYKGNKSQVSRVLGIAIRTLDKRIADYEKADAEQAERETAERERIRKEIERHRGSPHPSNVRVGYTDSPFDPRNKPGYQAR